jgi:hypothetical protein
VQQGGGAEILLVELVIYRADGVDGGIGAP